jgi:hypothetical protein
MIRQILVVLLLCGLTQSGFAENAALRSAQNASSSKDLPSKTAEQKIARAEALKKRLKGIDRMMEKVEVVRDYYPDRLEPLTDELQIEVEQINAELNALKGKTVIKKTTPSASGEQVSLMARDQNKPVKKTKTKKRRPQE